MTDSDVVMPTQRDPSLDSSAPAVVPALRLTAITKTFPGVRALDGVTLDVLPGEVHALVGENGAGKSTLMAVACGALTPDAGHVEIDGHALTTGSPDEARELGLGIVRQHPALLPDLSVAENMAIGVGYRRVGGLGHARAWSQDVLAPWEMGIDARSRIADLTVEQRFVVEIAKALALEPRVLILDEPTEHLSLEEVQRLFRRVREFAADGTAVVYISHRIPEVKQISDRITVLRDGAIRGTFAAAEVDENQIVELVIGRALDAVFPTKGSVAGTVGTDELLVVGSLSGPNFDDVSLSVRAGEIVGLAGVQGNGQASLVRALAGLDNASGAVTIAGRAVRLGSSASARAAGLVYVPGDRHDEGIFLPLSVADNTVMSTLGAVSSGGMVSRRAVDAAAQEQIERLAIKTPSPSTPVSSLSGGNQQKVVLARTLLAAPQVLVAEEPTRGVDAGARAEIYQILREAADRGAAVLILSSDGVELEGLCDRVMIMSRGSIVAQLEGNDVTESRITGAALTSTTVRNRVTARAERRGRFRSWLSGDHSPAAVLGLIAVLLALYVGSSNPTYFSTFNINNLLFMAAPLILVGVAQHVVVLGAGIDLSVGPLMGFLVVVSSFWIVDGGNVVVGLALMAVVALVVGLVNGVLISMFNLNPVVVTLAMFMGLQGLYLTLRSTPGGVISAGVSAQISAHVSFVPTVTIVAAIVALAMERLLRRSRWGVELRALGSNRSAAESLGVKVFRTQVLSYVVCSLLTLPAALIVMAQIGIGDGRPSLSYTLSSITVVVLAGASVFGGRGSFVGVLAATLLVQQILNSSPFLGLSQAWSYWLPGLITLGSAALYAQLRRTRKAS